MNQDKASGGGAGVETPDPVREAFEKAIQCSSAEVNARNIRRHPDGYYVEDRIDAIWDGWKMRALAQTKPAPEPASLSLAKVRDLIQSLPQLSTRYDLDDPAAQWIDRVELLKLLPPIPPKGADPQIDVHLAEATNKGKEA